MRTRLLPSKLISLLCAAVAIAADGPSSFADQTLLLDSALDSAQARMDVLLGPEPFVSVYAIREDQIGLATLARLRRAAREGRKPRLLVDGVGNKLSNEMMAYLAQEGVDVRIFRPKSLQGYLTLDYNLTNRMHDKITTTASDELITGGRNLEDQYFSLSNFKDANIDTDVYVRGKTARDARAYQFEVFNGPNATPPPDANLSQEMKSRIAAALDSHDHYLEEIGYVDLRGKARKWEARAIEANVEFVRDRVVNGDHGGAEEALLKLIREAREEIVIDAQYFILTPDIEEALTAAVKRQVAVRIVMNGEGAASVAMDGLIRKTAQLDMDRYRKAGFEVRAYQGVGKIHSKLVVADGKSCLAWSFNLDPRSRFLNLEAGVLIQSKAICEKARQTVYSRLQLSEPVVRGGQLMSTPECIGLYDRLKIKLLRSQL